MLEMVPDGLDRLRATWAKKPEIFIGDVQMGSEDLHTRAASGLIRHSVIFRMGELCSVPIFKGQGR